MRLTKVNYETRWLLMAFSLIPVAITPFMNMDAINLIKMALLGLFAFGSTAFLRKSRFESSEVRWIFVISLGFCVSMLISASLTSPSFWLQFWGAQGRNSGIFTFMSFILIFFVVASKSNSSMGLNILLAIPFVGLINIIYGLVQYLGKDPIYWRNPYSPIVGTLGNPNFISSHLGLVSGACILLIWYFWHQKKPRRYELSFILLIETFAALFVTWKSLSIQGLLVFGIVISSSVLLSVIVLLRRKIVTFLITAITISTALICSFGFFGNGPLGSLLYRESFVHRTHFWEAGIQMLRSNPFTGIGIDQFGDFYRQYRSSSAIQLRGPNVVTDSAHNIPIEIASGGGIFPLIFYMLIQFTVLFCGLRMIGRIKEIDTVKIGILSLWIGYQAQTLIGINQVGLSIWGWIFSGLVIGLSLETRSTGSNPLKTTTKSLRSRHSVRVAIFGFLGLAMAMPPLLQDRAYRMALQTQNGAQIIAASKSNPLNTFYFNYTSILLNSSGYKSQSLELSKLAVEINQRNYPGWRLILNNSDPGSSDYSLALKNMRLLDPLNDELPRP